MRCAMGFFSVTCFDIAMRDEIGFAAYNNYVGDIKGCK